ncbi:SGNH/GDSL hydrolase family protein [Pedobacter sp. L105]|uniref:SGNH/GDSL hydrolase family protein n=1 Tax=Pedobacter sp. L105 TaxID=1641871 RepID=UPI00131D3E0B|nr:SGNH/GDSL hydrolase family protein [Pedobacter sp. L105]
MITKKLVHLTAIAVLMLLSSLQAKNKVQLQFFPADHPNIQYTGRIDFSNPKLPRFWSPGVYIQLKFKGDRCQLIIHDEVLYHNTYNYIEISVDHQQPYRIQTRGTTDTITVSKGLTRTEHTLTICKDTESGYLEFEGIKCEQLLPLPAKPKHQIEYIGDSITCGTGSDLSIPCNQGPWYDQHNAYLSYGPSSARLLQAQWQLTAVSGIGLLHSCCEMKILMPQVFDKMNLRENAVPWDFNRYQPDVVTICLGQNDGVQDSVKYAAGYLDFIKTIRSHYPSAAIVCLNSPMADAALTRVLKNYLTGIVKSINASGDKMVSSYFFSRQFNHGCGGHPDLAEHEVMAKELASYIEKLEKW